MANNILSLLFLAVSMAVIPSAANASAMIEIVEQDQQSVQIVNQDNAIYVSGANGQTMSVYNVAGVCVYTIKIDSQEKRIELSLPKGCYIIKVGKTARKISIK